MAQSQKRLDAGRIPGPAAIPGVVEVVIAWNQMNGKIGHTYLHGRNSGSFTPSVTTANALMASFASSFATNLASFAPTATSLASVTVRDMSVVTNPIFQSTTAAQAGTSASASMPPGVALVMTENIAARGRGAKGRVYLPLWATNADAGSGTVVTPGVPNGVNAFGTSIISGMSAQGLVACVAKPARQAYTGITGTNHPARAAGSVDVSAYVLRDNNWDTQRRRGYVA